MKKLLLALLLISFNLHWLQAEIFYRHLNVENGLSQTTVFSIYQDEAGRIWMGTKDGLNCYDGNKITVFKPNPNDPKAIFGNNIEELTGGQNGVIYIRCKYGLVTLNLKSMEFQTIIDSSVYCINYGKKLWSCSKNKVQYLDEQKNTLTTFCQFNTPNLQISSIKESSNKLLYVGTRDHGLYIINENKQPKLLIPNIGVSCIYEDSKHNIWVGSRQDGLFKISNTAGIENFKHHPKEPFSINSNIVRCIVEDNFGYYWLGTMAGVNRFDPNKQIFEQVDTFNGITTTENNNSILSIIKDTQGTLWIGTYYGGVSYFNPEYEIYRYYKSDDSKQSKLSSPTIGIMAEDAKGNLWICTEGGLNFFNRENNSFTAYLQHKEKNPNYTNVVKSVSIDKKHNCLWIGTIFSGLNKLDLKSKQIQRVEMPVDQGKVIYDNSIRRIIDYDDSLYLATHRGIVIYCKKSNSFQKLRVTEQDRFDKFQIIDMLLDEQQQQLWFSCSNGVYRYNLADHTVESYSNYDVCKEKTYNRVNCFYQDNQRRLWLGTSGNGLSYYDPKGKQFKKYLPDSSSMENAYIVAISETKMGYLLVVTNKGLLRIDPQTGLLDLYNTTTGFPLSVINEGALHVTADNEIFVGGINGLISFSEKDMNRLSKKYNINIVGIEINNTPVPINDPSGILHESILTQDKIELEYKHKVISFEFASSNYIKAIDSDIEYRLKGFDKTWIKAGDRRLITYTNLDAGSYTLQIRGGNRKGVEDPITKELQIEIAPPFYRTFWAYMGYSLFFSMILLFIIRFYTSRVKLQSSLEYEKKEKEQIELMNQSKQNFFINVSHEFRTPLTLIMGNIEYLLQATNLSPIIHKKIQSTYRNAERLNTLISELLEFSKLEIGTTKVKVSKQNIISLLNEIYLNFKEYAVFKHINFQFICTSEDIELFIDFGHMEKVFYNLVANAFNYTPENGRITLSVQEGDQFVYIRVEDTGMGMEPEQLDKIFERFYQIDHASKRNNNNHHNGGSGIGLAYSKTLVEAHGGKIQVSSQLEKGSIFTVVLQKEKEHLFDVKIVETIDRDRKCIQNIEQPNEDFFQDILASADPKITTSILIVEDNPEMVELLVELFKPIYKTHIAFNGQEGIGKAIDLQPDLILSDVMMPCLSGTEMCSILKCKAETCHIPIVLLTAKAALTYTLEGLKTGADDYITKPFNAKELIARCNNLICNRQLMQKKFAHQTDFTPHLITTNDTDQIFLEKAYRVIEGNITNPEFSIDQLCREIGMGRTNLFSKIKGITGMTPNNFIQNIKLKKGLSLLQRSSLSISEIAYDLGFSSPSYFIKCFKSLFEKTPSEIRKEMKREDLLNQ